MSCDIVYRCVLEQRIAGPAQGRPGRSCSRSGAVRHALRSLVAARDRLIAPWSSCAGGVELLGERHLDVHLSGRHTPILCNQGSGGLRRQLNLDDAPESLFSGTPPMIEESASNGRGSCPAAAGHAGSLPRLRCGGSTPSRRGICCSACASGSRRLSRPSDACHRNRQHPARAHSGASSHSPSRTGVPGIPVVGVSRSFPTATRLADLDAGMRITAGRGDRGTTSTLLHENEESSRACWMRSTGAVRAAGDTSSTAARSPPDSSMPWSGARGAGCVPACCSRLRCPGPPARRTPPPAGAGVDLRFYNPLALGKLRQPAARSPELLVADGRVAYVGGAGSPRIRPRRARAWRKLMVEIRGPVVGDWQQVFARAGGAGVRRLGWRSRRRARQSARRPGRRSLSGAATFGSHGVSRLDRPPRRAWMRKR